MAKRSWIGQTLSGRYQIEELLGQGGMSAVYKATDPNLRRVVAIKLIHPHLSDQQDFVRRFEEEAAAVAQLRHSNIVQVYDFNHDDGDYFMVLEFVPGETLQDRLKRLNKAGRAMPVEDALRYTAQVCSAVDYAHQRGMVHRDIKPANIMLSVYQTAVLMDFGIAKMMGGTQHTATGAVVGTALYMSPEQIQGERVDERTDIYSLGVTLYEMLSGRPPFEADSAMTLMMMHINDPVPDIRQLKPDLPDEVVTILNRALAKKRDNRFSSAAQMEQALLATLGRLASSAEEIAAVAPPSGDTMIQPEPLDVQERPSLDPSVEETGPLKPITRPEPAATDLEPAFLGAQAMPTSATPSAGDAATDYQRVVAGTPGASERGATRGGAGRVIEPVVEPEPGRRLPFSKPVMIGGAGALALIVIVLLLVLSGGGGGGEAASIGQASTATETQPAALPVVVDEPTATETQSPTPTATETRVPTATNTVPPTLTPTITLTPTVTVPPGIPYVRINDITIRGGRYVVEYETFEYTEVVPGTHVHFFFDTVSQQNAGSPGTGPWKLYGGPRPFQVYGVADRPAAATKMCALVANPNHSIQFDSGNCFDLPVE